MYKRQHLHEARDVDPTEALTRAARAGLTVTPEACALLGVDVGEVEALMRARAGERQAGRAGSG